MNGSFMLQAALQSSPTQDLHQILQSEMQAVNAIILESLQSQAPLIPQLARHLINAGGKRIRPVLTVACSRIFGDREQQALKLAAAVEFIHTATLLHDDVVDDSHLRRGKPSANDVWGNQSSVLVGDFLFARSFQLMVQVGCPEVLMTLSNAAARIAEGEVMQLTSSYDLGLTVENALAVMGAKTAELFAASTKVGAMVANQTAEMTQKLYDYGYNLGMLFQIIDDILDYTADQTTLGKRVGDDFMEGKVTLPLLLTYQSLKKNDQKIIEDLFNASERTVDDFKKVQQSMIKSKGLSKAYDMAQSFSNKALESLEDVPSGPLTKALEGLIHECLRRSS